MPTSGSPLSRRTQRRNRRLSNSAKGSVTSDDAASHTSETDSGYRTSSLSPLTKYVTLAEEVATISEDAVSVDAQSPSRPSTPQRLYQHLETDEDSDNQSTTSKDPFRSLEDEDELQPDYNYRSSQPTTSSERPWQENLELHIHSRLNNLFQPKQNVWKALEMHAEAVLDLKTSNAFPTGITAKPLALAKDFLEM